MLDLRPAPFLLAFTTPTCIVNGGVFLSWDLVFEFTCRKRWADILVSKVLGTLMLILNAAGLILYSGAAIKELLGWEVEDFINKTVLNLLSSPSPTCLAALCLCSACSPAAHR